MPSTATQTQPLLGRCKECDYALFVAPETPTVDADGFKDVRGDGRAYRVGNEGFFSRCPNRHKVFVLKRIKGTYSPDHKCDSRCLNAKGHECTCSCGGANHGRGFAAQVVEASAEPAVPVQTSEGATDKQVAFIRRLLDERVIPDKDPVGGVVYTGAQRRQHALDKLDAGEFTKRQASATIEWLLSLPKVQDPEQIAMEVGS